LNGDILKVVGAKFHKIRDWKEYGDYFPILSSIKELREIAGMTGTPLTEDQEKTITKFALDAFDDLLLAAKKCVAVGELFEAGTYMSNIYEISEKTGVSFTLEEEEKIGELAPKAFNALLAKGMRFVKGGDYSGVYSTVLKLNNIIKMVENSFTKDEKQKLKEKVEDLALKAVEGLPANVEEYAGRGKYARINLNISNVRKLVESAGLSLTDDHKKRMEQLAPREIKYLLIEASQEATAGNYPVAASCMLDIYEILEKAKVEKTEVSLTRGEEEKIGKLAPKTIKGLLGPALKHGNSGYSIDFDRYMSLARKLTERTGIISFTTTIEEMEKLAWTNGVDENLKWVLKWGQFNPSKVARYVLQALKDAKRAGMTSLTEEQKRMLRDIREIPSKI
jgi:hypothetical protein